MADCAGIYPGPDQLPGLGWSVTREPIHPMRSQRAVAGNEWRGLDYAWPLRRWTLTYNFLRERWASDLGGLRSELSILEGFFGWALGAGKCFCFLDPEDNYVFGARLLMLNSWTLAVGNGVTTSFQLARPIVPDQADNSEPITAPYTVDQIYLNGVPAVDNGFTWTVDYATGIITLVSANLNRITQSLATRITMGGATRIISTSGGQTDAIGVGVIPTADFGYYWRARFVEDALSFEQFMLRLWSQKKVQLISCGIEAKPLSPPPPPPPPVMQVLDGAVPYQTTVSPSVPSRTFTFVTTLPDDIIIVMVGIDAEGPNAGPLPPSVISVFDTAPLTWAQRSAVAGDSGPWLFGESWSDFEIWWAHAPTPGSYDITVDTMSELGWLNVIIFAVNGCRLPNPWNPNPAAIASAFGASPPASLPQVNGVASPAANGLGLVFCYGTGTDSFALHTAATRNSWNGSPWNATDNGSPFYVPGTCLAFTQQIQAFIDLIGTMTVFGQFFHFAPFSGQSFGAVDPTAFPAGLRWWATIGDTLVAA